MSQMRVLQLSFDYLQPLGPSQIILRSEISVCSHFQGDNVLSLWSLVLCARFKKVLSYLFYLLKQATRGLSSGGARSSQWATGGTRPSVTLVPHPGFSGQDRIPEATDVLWDSRNIER